MNTYVLEEYITLDSKSPFSEWFDLLKGIEAAKVSKAIYQLEQGNFSKVKSLGEGVFEYKIDYGPGYRIYFGQDKNVVVILLYGGTKKRQQQDINKAKLLWKDYKQRKCC